MDERLCKLDKTYSKSKGIHTAIKSEDAAVGPSGEVPFSKFSNFHFCFVFTSIYHRSELSKKLDCTEDACIKKIAFTITTSKWSPPFLFFSARSAEKNFYMIATQEPFVLKARRIFFQKLESETAKNSLGKIAFSLTKHSNFRFGAKFSKNGGQESGLGGRPAG